MTVYHGLRGAAPPANAVVSTTTYTGPGWPLLVAGAAGLYMIGGTTGLVIGAAVFGVVLLGISGIH